MPPAKNEQCKYDDAGWRERVEDTLWRSKDSHSNRIMELETEAKALRRFMQLWLPIIFTVGTAGFVWLLDKLPLLFPRGGSP